MSAATLRTLARELGLSAANVSAALRGSSRVNAATAKRICQAAAQAGYHRNPLTGAVMSELRRSKGQVVRGVLAVLELMPADRRSYENRFNAVLLGGIVARAGKLGFNVERFEIGAGGHTLHSVDAVLGSRPIQGVLILPVSDPPDLSGMTWERYAALYVDYYIAHPPLHCVSPDHYRAMVALVQELHHRGYRRPGLVMDTRMDSRLHFRWEGAFRAVQQSLYGTANAPILLLDTPGELQFASWFKQHDPDVVLTHFYEALGWMVSCGAKLGETHGYVCLNSFRTKGDCAALDLQPELLGARATDLVISQLLNNEYGIPQHASLTTIPARLLDGPTLYPAPPLGV